MLPKKNRLPAYLIPQILKTGQRFYGQLLTLVIIYKQNNEIQLAIIVPKKINKKAVMRNKIKRRFREAVKNCLPLVKPGIKAVFLVKKKAMTANFFLIKAEIKKIFTQANLLKTTLKSD